VPRAATLGFAKGMAIFGKYYELTLEKYSARPITLSHDGILTKDLMHVRCGALEMRIAVSHE
jgi:hypothetical protein